MSIQSLHFPVELYRSSIKCTVTQGQRLYCQITWAPGQGAAVERHITVTGAYNESAVLVLCSCQKDCSSCCKARQTAKKRAPVPCHGGPCGPGQVTGGTRRQLTEGSQIPKLSRSLHLAKGMQHGQLKYTQPQEGLSLMLFNIKQLTNVLLALCLNSVLHHNGGLSCVDSLQSHCFYRHI